MAWPRLDSCCRRQWSFCPKIDRQSNKIRETTPSQGREYIHTAPPKASIQQLVVGWLCVKDVPAVSPAYKFRDRGISGKTLSIPEHSLRLSFPPRCHWWWYLGTTAL